MSARSSQASADSTSDSTEQDSPTDSSVSRTRTDDESSQGIGRGCRSTRTWRSWDALNHTEDELVPTMGQNTGQATGRAALISSAADSPAKTSPSPADAQGLQESEAASSSSSPESPTLFDPSGYSSRTYPVSCPVVPARDAEGASDFYESIAEGGRSLEEAPDEILASACSSLALIRAVPWMGSHVLETVQAAARVGVALRPDASLIDTTGPSSRWSAESSATSGMESPGELWTAVSSECRSADGECSSSETKLADVLEPSVAPRFSLSAKAARGILRRADKRGRELPTQLEKALRALSTKDAEAMTPTRRTAS